MDRFSGSSNFWRGNFDALGNSPGIWIHQAEQFLRAQEILKKVYLQDMNNVIEGKLSNDKAGYSVHSPQLMLCGYALECFYKALILKQGGELAEDGKFSLTGVSGHDLLGLAKLTDYPKKLTQDQNSLLKRLSYFITGGRYPIPKSFEQTIPKIQPNRGIMPDGFWITPQDDNTFDEFVEQLKNELNTKPID